MSTIAYRKFRRRKLAFLEDAGNSKIEAISSQEAEIASSEVEKINRYFAISSLSLGLATAGTLAYPPLSLVSVGPTVYATIPILKVAYKSLFKEGKVNIAVLESTVSIVCVITGHFFFAAMGPCAYFLRRKFLTSRRPLSESLCQMET